ncbi:hypothetical protein K6U16_14445 [Vibrio parahaemolyticus]|uniref:hypothetical protein n=1 Tax=Vibrio parahaemolyticus TaxID=670 RepID=UPI001EE9BFF4|nr:hypothetical protein [Vibrio parahaemolyticus]MCG6424173.1 hypothetical protein [Vibrio parahaemolyticus]
MLVRLHRGSDCTHLTRGRRLLSLADHEVGGGGGGGGGGEVGGHKLLVRMTSVAVANAAVHGRGKGQEAQVKGWATQYLEAAATTLIT